jgi:hypothetical protein
MMGRKTITSIVLIILIGSISIMGNGAGGEDHFIHISTVHPPIQIDNSSHLREIASIEGWAGNGTQGDPFVIENITIDGNYSSHCISISNSEEHLVIRDSRFVNGGRWRYGYFYPGSIYTSSCRNITIRNCSIDQMEIQTTTDLVIESIGFEEDNGTRLLLSNCGRTLISNVDLGNHTSTLSYCGNLEMRNCILRGKDALLDIYSGWWVSGDVVIRNCTFRDTINGTIPQGMRLRNSYNTHLYNNDFIHSYPEISIYSDASFLDSISLPTNNTVFGSPLRAYFSMDMEQRDIPPDSDYYIFIDSSNISLEGLEMASPSIGIHIISCSGVSMEDVSLPSGSILGMKIERTGGLVINDSMFICDDLGIQLTSSMDFEISNSTFSGCDIGLEIEYAYNGGDFEGEVSGCEFIDCGIGLRSYDFDRVNIHGCRFKRAGIGMEVERSFGWRISENEFNSCNGSAVSMLSGSLENWVYWNSFRDNNQQMTDIPQVFDGSEITRWYHPTIQEGNLWSDHLIPDSNLDGIVDDPYAIVNGTTYDQYPLVSYPGTHLNTPENFSIEVDEGEVKMTWDRPSGPVFPVLKGFHIYRNRTGNKTLTRMDIESGKRSHTDRMVSFGDEYNYWITSYNSREESDPSEVLTTFIFDRPGTIGAMNHSCNRTAMNISWEMPSYDGGSPVLGYRVYRSLSPIAWTQIAETESPFYFDDDIEIGLTYYYFLTAFNIIGEGELSDAFMAEAYTIPDPPDLDVVSTGNDFILIEWEKPEFVGGTEILGYNIYRGEEEGILSLISSTDPSVREYNDTSLPEDTTYFYMIRAVNSEGESPASNVINVTVGMIRPDLPRPYSLIATPGNGHVVLSFSKPDWGEDLVFLHYQIYRRETGYDFGLLTTSASTRYRDDTVINGIEYEYFVTAVYTNGESGPSQMMNATPEAGISPFGLPRDLSVESGDGYVIIRWKEPADERNGSILKYNIYSGNSSEVAEPIGFADGSQLTMMINGLIDGETYRFYISAVYLQGESGLAGPVEGTPSSTEEPPGMPVSFQASLNVSGVMLKWSQPAQKVNGYRIYRSIAGSDPILIADLEGTEYLDANISDGESYRYFVTAYNENGEGPGTMDVLFSIPIPDEDADEGSQRGIGTWVYLAIGAAIILMLLLLVFILSRTRDPSSPDEE